MLWRKTRPEEQNDESGTQSPEQFSVQMNCFTWIGFNREGQTKYPKVFRLLHIVDTILLFNVALSEFGFMITNLDNIMEAAECYATFSVEIMVIAKFLSYIAYEQRFYGLMDKVKTNARTATSPDADSLAVKRAIKFERAVTLAYLVSVIVTVGFVYSPIVVEFVNFWFFGVAKKREMPIKVAVPFATNVSPAYEIEYFLFVVAVRINTIQTVSFDKLFCVMIC